MGNCFFTNVNKIYMDDALPYNYYNHYSNPYVLIYIYSGKAGYVTIKMYKTSVWEKIFNEIKEMKTFDLFNVPNDYYQNNPKFYFKITYPFINFFNKKNAYNKPIFTAKKIYINGELWRLN